MAQYGSYADTFDGDTNPWPSAALWSKVDAENERPGRWFGAYKEFAHLPLTALPTTEAAYDGYRYFSDTGGVFTAQDVEGGVVNLGSDGDNESAAVAQANQPFKIIQGHGELVFEARVYRTVITDDLFGTFIGLGDSTTLVNDVPITDGDALADMNLVGFFGTEDDGDTYDTVYKADSVTAVTVKADAATISAAATWHKLGMTFNRAVDGSDDYLTYWYDGIPLLDRKYIPAAAGTDFPNDLRLGWMLGVMNSAATSEKLWVDWVRVAQKRVSGIS